jgi:RimJ/RimL family protein N-acetyltransferase
MYKCLKKNSFGCGTLQLVPVRKQDILLIMRWRNEQLDILRQDKKMSRSEQEQYYRRNVWPCFDEKEPEQLLFSILEDNECIGYGGIVHIDWLDKRGEVSFLIKTEMNDDLSEFRRLFKQFLGWMCTIAFDYLGFNKLTTEVYDIRPYLLDILESCGYVQEGRLRSHVRIKDRLIDSVLHAMHRDRYQQMNKHRAQNVLMTSIGNKVSHVKEAANAAKRIHPECKIFGADLDPACTARYFVDEFWQIPAPETLPSQDLLGYLARNNIYAIIPTRNGELLHYSNNIDVLATNGVSIMVSAPAALETCLDKLTFYERCNKEGLAVIPTSSDISQIDCESFVVKERYGAGARKIRLKLTKEQAADYAKRLEHPVFQPFIGGREITVDCYVDRQGVLKGQISRYRDKVVNGESQITTTFYDERLNAACARFVSLYPFYGHVNVQFIIDPRGEFHLMECNPRIGGASALSFHAGLDSIYWFLLESYGEDIAGYNFRPDEKKTITMIRYKEQKFISQQ